MLWLRGVGVGVVACVSDVVVVVCGLLFGGVVVGGVDIGVVVSAVVVANVGVVGVAVIVSVVVCFVFVLLWLSAWVLLSLLFVLVAVVGVLFAPS